jgi:PASTA domain
MRRVAAAVLFATLVLAACGSDSVSAPATTSRVEREASTTTAAPVASTTTTTAAPQMRPVPDVTNVTLMFANQHADGFDLESVDLAPQLLGASETRAQFDTSTWYVLGQCPKKGELAPAGSRVGVGVLKVDEVPVGQMRVNAIAGAYDVASCLPSEDTSAPALKTAVMPNVVCKSLQDAQDTIQRAGVKFSRSEDGSGQGRSQLIDSNWQVVRQSPAPGTPFGEGDAVLTAVKYDEPSPC